MSKKAFQGILAGLNDAIAYNKGDKSRAARVIHVKPIDVAKVRKKTKLSQEDFSRTYAIPLTTLRNWEQGIRAPSGPAAVLLHVIDKQPAVVTKVAKSVATRA
jgi:putative transcriptional regulator